MASVGKQLADAVAAWLQNELAGDLASLVNSPSVKSLLAPHFDLRSITGTEFQVWPNDRTTELLTRADFDARHETAIAVVARLPATTDANPADPDATEDAFSDKLLEVTEQIANRLLGMSLLDPAYTFIESRHEPFYDRNLLETNRLFAAGVVVTCRGEVHRTN